MKRADQRPTGRQPDSETSLQHLSQQVRGLRAAIYTRRNPVSDLATFSELNRLEEELLKATGAAGKSSGNALSPPAADSAAPASAGQPERDKPLSQDFADRLLGPDTTKLQVDVQLNMQPVPTGIYHLLDPERDPLVTVTVRNLNDDADEARRLKVTTYIEGLSAQAVRTIEVRPPMPGKAGGPDTVKTLKLLPTLFPERAAAVTEIQRATLHVLVDDLDNKPESHDTFSIVCLARTSSFNAVHDPVSGRWVDLTHYYGAWVTPYAEAVQGRIRRAADLMPKKQIWGYQGEKRVVRRQVKALYDALKEAGIIYVNSVTDYGAPVGQATQRTRLPRESLAGSSANCIDGTVLMASLLEGASLNAALVIVPGHAFVGWETWGGSGNWEFLETTMIGTAGFPAACAAGERQYKAQKNLPTTRVHYLPDLRAQGIWPME